MMPFDSFTTSIAQLASWLASALVPLAEPVARSLAHFLWQAALIGLVVAALLAVLRRARPARRYGVALAGLVAMAAMPVLTLVSVQTAGSVPAGARAVAGDARAVAMAVAGAASVERADARSSQDSRAGLFAKLESGLGRVDAWVTARRQMLASLWLAGVCSLLLIHAGGVRRLGALLATSLPATDAWRHDVQRLARSMGIRRPVDVMESAAVAVPMVVGWLRPTILVPASAFFGLSAQQLETVFAHELAHVRRADFLVNLFQVAMETLFFYHPAVWWLSRQVRIEREHCCDDLAVSVSGSAKTYLQALASLEALRTTPRALALPKLALGADGGSLLARVRRLADDRRPGVAGLGDPGLGGRIFGTALAAVFAALLAAAGVFLTDTGSAAAAPVASAEAEETGDDWHFDSDGAGDWVEEDARELRAAAAATPWAGLDDTTFRQLARWGFDEDLFSALERAGIAATGDDLQTVARYGIDRDLIDAVQRVGLAADIATLTSFGRYGLDGDDLLDYQRAGLAGSAESVLQMARYGLDGSDLSELAAAGYPNLTPDALVDLARHGVDGDEVAELAAAGYTGLTVSELVTLARHGVDGEDIQVLARAGHAGLSVDELVELARHGLDGEDIAELQDAGLGELSLDEIRTLARYGVDGDDVTELAQAGLKDLSVEQLLGLARHGVDGDDVAELAHAGLGGLTVDQVVGLARYGIDGDDVSTARDAGYAVTYDELMKLARSGRLWQLDDDDDDTSVDWN